MTTTVCKLTAVTLAAALSACATSPPSMRIATTQGEGVQVYGDTVHRLADCEAGDGGFNAADAMKLSKDAFSGCLPR
jgi:hypothetical protein